MILIGQYDSPFVRRVAIALRLYGLPFEHRPWSTFGEGDKIAPYNPLRRGGRAGKGCYRGARAGAQACVEDLRAGDRARGQGCEPALRTRAAQGSVENL